MRFLLLVALLFLFCSNVLAADHDRNVAGKLTEYQKPQVRVFTATERATLAKDTAVLDLDVDPNQILCKKVRVGPSSRLTTRRCKTRAEFRREDDKNRSLAAKLFEDERRRFATRTRGNERPPRIRIRRPASKK